MAGPLVADSYSALSALVQRDQAMHQEALAQARNQRLAERRLIYEQGMNDALFRERQNQQAEESRYRRLNYESQQKRDVRATEYQDWLMRQPTAIQQRERSLMIEQATRDADDGL